MPPSPDRAANRSRTYQGIADAMAQQWGGDLRGGHDLKLPQWYEEQKAKQLATD